MKKILMVGYDESAGQNYSPLYGALRKFDNIHPCDSTWFIKVSGNTSPEQVRDHLWQFMYSNDKLIVFDVTAQVFSENGLSVADYVWLRNY